jgi:hypothetical protein
MKKIIFLTTYLIATSITAFAQLKHDYVWTMGYGKIGPSQIGYPFGGVVMDFNDSPLSLTLTEYIIDSPNAAISDKNGRLVAYTDGCRIINRKHKLMFNGDTLNPGEVYNEFCSIVSYPLWQSTLFLPKPESDSLYYLFHIRDDDMFHDPMNLMYSVLDASGDNGDGIVRSKNNSILSDSLYLGDYVTATRHGNGRDWWIVVQRRYSKGFHVSLLTPKGVTYMGIQYVVSKIDNSFWGSQAAFSQNGSKYFRNSQEGLLMLDFDRCNGTFSNPVYLDWDSNPFGGYGAATSPNSRYLYLSSGGTVQQYDLLSADLAASMQVVATYDGTLSPNPANFFQMMPGPDGKIYISTSNSNIALHVIHHPNEPGLACNVEQHAIILPARNIYFVPNFANYNLYDIPGSTCDTLGINAPMVSTTTPNLSKEETIQIFPNPTKDLLNLQIGQPFQEGIGSVYNMQGHLLRSIAFSKEMPQMRNMNLESGIYFLSIALDGKIMPMCRFVVIP